MKRGARPLSHYTVALEDGRGDSSRCARSYGAWLQICHVNAVELRAHARRDSLDKPSLSESFCSFFFAIAIVILCCYGRHGVRIRRIQVQTRDVSSKAANKVIIVIARVARDLWQRKQTLSSGCALVLGWFTAINPRPRAITYKPRLHVALKPLWKPV